MGNRRTGPAVFRVLISQYFNDDYIVLHVQESLLIFPTSSFLSVLLKRNAGQCWSPAHHLPSLPASFWNFQALLAGPHSPLFCPSPGRFLSP